MAKEKLYYYECIATCQMGFMAPSTRREDFTEEGIPPMVLHERSFYPAGLGKKRPDYLVTKAPISKRYTEPVLRKFKKMDLRTREYVDVVSPTTPKFVLLEPEEIGDYIREHARKMTLRPCDLAESDKEPVGAANVER